MNTEYFSKEVKLDLGKLYGTNKERTEFTINFYKELYDLQTLNLIDEVTPELFKYCIKRDYFVLIIAHQEDRIFLKRVMYDSLNWELPGSSIHSKGKELLEDAVSRIIERDIPDIEMSEMTPVAHLKKTYKCGEDDVTHFGIAFMGRVRYPDYRSLESNEDIKGRFVRLLDTCEINRLSKYQMKLVNLCFKIFSTYKVENKESIDLEISMTNSIPTNIMKFHNSFVRPIGKYFSSNLIKKEILKYVKPDYRIIDVACGDDDFIFKLSEKVKICVGNDVQWNQIQHLNERERERTNIIFTNHDARNLPFKIKFDLAICKNLVHHMDTPEDLKTLFQSLSRISKRILIVDPEDPSDGGKRAKIWHWYYKEILLDQGEKFFHYNTFKNTIEDVFQDAEEIKFSQIETIKGKFMFSHIELKNEKMISSQIKVIKIKGIIFDLDGLIADTEELFFSSIRDELKHHDVNISLEDYIKHDLQNGTSLLETLAKSNKITNINDITKKIYNNYRKKIKLKVLPMTGAIEVLKELKNNYRLAIASSSKKEFIDIILENLEIKDLFEVIVSRECVKNLKPHPDCLLETLERLDLDVEDVIFIEDTLRGIRAAQKIKMKSILIPNNLISNKDFDNYEFIHSIKDLPNYISNIERI